MVGIQGVVADDNTFKSVGITCALCHSTVDDSFSPGIGKRLDGWPNRDLNVGKIIALARRLGLERSFQLRIGVNTGFCTVGNGRRPPSDRVQGGREERSS